MTRLPKFALLLSLALLTVLAAPVARGQEEAEPAKAQMTVRHGDLVSVFSREIEVPEGVIQNGSVVCVGCAGVVVRGNVTQDVVVVLSKAEITGRVGTVVGVLSDLDVRDTEIGGDLVSVLGSLNIENLHVRGDMVRVLSGFEEKGANRVGGESIGIGAFGAWLPSVWWLIFWLRLLHKVCVFVLILLLVALIPDRIRIIGEEAPVRFVPAFFMGLLGYLAWLVVIGLLGATVVGIPLAVLGLYAMKWMGIAGIFCAIGRRLGRSFGREMSTLGAVLLVFAAYSALMILPTPFGIFGLVFSSIIGLLFFLLVEVPGLGLVILTRFGSPPRPATPQTTIVPGPAAAVARRPDVQEAEPGEPRAPDRPV